MEHFVFIYFVFKFKYFNLNNYLRNAEQINVLLSLFFFESLMKMNQMCVTDMDLIWKINLKLYDRLIQSN